MVPSARSAGLGPPRRPLTAELSRDSELPRIERVDFGRTKHGFADPDGCVAAHRLFAYAAGSHSCCRKDRAPFRIFLIVQILLLIAVGRGLGEIMQRIGQPSVVGELLAGLILGPSLFGWLWSAAQNAIFPAAPVIGRRPALAHLFGRKSPRGDFERKQRPAPRRQMTTPNKEHNQPLKNTRF